MKIIKFLIPAFIIFGLWGCLNQTSDWEKATEQRNNYLNKTISENDSVIRTYENGITCIIRKVSNDTVSPKLGDVVILNYTFSLIDEYILGTTDIYLAKSNNIFSEYLLYGKTRFIVGASYVTGLYVGNEILISYPIIGIDEGLLFAKSGCEMEVVIPPERGIGYTNYGPIPSYSNLSWDIIVDTIIPQAQIMNYENEQISNYLAENHPQTTLFDTTAQGVIIIDEIKLELDSTIQAGDSVKLNMVGQLLDGRIFDKSEIRYFKQGFTGYTSNIYYKHIDIALKGKSLGDKFKIIIPYYVGYPLGSIGLFPPYSTVLYEVEILE